MHINSISKIEEVAEFISMMNKDITQHVGYCGENHEEILDAILHGFSDIGGRSLLSFLIMIIMKL